MNSTGVRVTLMLTTPGWRGSGRMFAGIAAGLGRSGHSVQLIVGHPDVAAQLEAMGVTVQLVPTGDTGRREVALVRRLLDSHRTAVIIADSPRDVRIARYASLLRGRSIIWRYNLHSRKLATDPLQRWLFGGLDKLVHLSRYGRDKLVSDSPWLARIPSAVIPNGVDIDSLPESPGRGSATRARMGLTDDDLLVVTPTPDIAEKRVDVARAAVEMVASRRRITWLVTDSVAPSDNPDLDVVAVGRLKPEQLHDVIRAADVVLLPSPVELFGNVTAESMALGRAVVAAASGATPELVADAGELFPPGDAEAAARLMTGLLDDPARRDRLGQAARARVAAEYPMSRMIDGYDALVRRR